MLHPIPVVPAELPRSSGKFSWLIKFEAPLSKVNIPQITVSTHKPVRLQKRHLHWKINSDLFQISKVKVTIPSFKKTGLWEDYKSGHERRSDPPPTATRRSDSAWRIHPIPPKLPERSLTQSRLPDFKSSRSAQRNTPRFRQNYRMNENGREEERARAFPT